MIPLPKRQKCVSKSKQIAVPHLRFHCVVVGGGVAGVSCAEELLRLQNSISSSICLITCSNSVKYVSIVIWFKNLLQFTF